MWPLESSRKKRLVPLSSDLIEDRREVECVGDSRKTGRGMPSTSPQLLPLEIRRRHEGLAEGPLVMAPPPVSLTISPKSKPKSTKVKPIKEQKVEDSMIELWVRDPAVKNLAQRVRLSFAKDFGRPEKLTPSMVLTRLETRLDTLANGMRSLQRMMPILIDQNRKLIKGKNPCFTSKSSTSLSKPSRSDMILPSSSSDESRSISELDLRGDQLIESMEERNSTRELYYNMQMHLVNMLVVPKSHTSLLLNQRKDAMSPWNRGRGGHWQHQYTDQDWQRDLDAAAFLTGNSKNVRRQ